jgi:hypothetical protein
MIRENALKLPRKGVIHYTYNFCGLISDRKLEEWKTYNVFTRTAVVSLSRGTTTAVATVT